MVCVEVGGFRRWIASGRNWRRGPGCVVGGQCKRRSSVQCRFRERRNALHGRRKHLMDDVVVDRPDFRFHPFHMFGRNFRQELADDEVPSLRIFRSGVQTGLRPVR